MATLCWTGLSCSEWQGCIYTIERHAADILCLHSPVKNLEFQMVWFCIQNAMDALAILLWGVGGMLYKLSLDLFFPSRNCPGIHNVIKDHMKMTLID